MKPIEEIGLLKMDFLGLRNLDVIEDCLAIIEESTGERPDMATPAAGRPADLRDDGPRATRSACSSSSPTACATPCARSSPPSSRTWSRWSRSTGPGAMRHIDTYARNKRNPDAVSYFDERLRPITEATYAVILYQEQSMQIAKADRRLLGRRGGRPAQGDRQEEPRGDGRAARALLRGRPRQRHERGGDPASCGRSTRRPPTTPSTAPTPPVTR